MKNEKHSRSIGRREAMRRLMAGAGASAALPAARKSGNQASRAMPGMSAPGSPALGSAQPPDPSLSSKGWKPRFFDEHENETVIVLSELIIPETDTPGAKAAQVNRFIDLLLSAESPEKQKQFLQALGWLDGYCLSHYSNPFVKLSASQQNDVLTLLTREATEPEIAHGVELFKTIKQSVVEAYYSSEIGTLQELKYETNPFQPEFPGCKHPDGH